MIRTQLESIGQAHLLKFFDELSTEEQTHLEDDIRTSNLGSLSVEYTQQVSTQFEEGKLKPAIKIDSNLLKEFPSEHIKGTTMCTDEQLDEYRQIGLTNISQRKVAALLLAGGQGTRLGVDYPKGMYDVGLPSRKTLFQLQAERINELNDMVSSSTCPRASHIIWYIMTSEATMQRTRDFFRQHNFFNLDESDIVFFEQGTIPCFDLNGKILLDQKHKLSKSPNGNGGLYESLHKNGIIEHMKSNGVEYVHVFCVDNILVRVCDPAFMGYCISEGAEAGAKVVEKVQPNESLGTICKVGNHYKVIEYSEIPDSIANKRDDVSGKLVFNAGNICDHFFKVSFLESMNIDRKLRYHLAIKKIPHISLETGQRVKPVEPNGIKLEKFIFDAFEFTDKFNAWQVSRIDEFSPLKNADGTDKDNPTTARAALLRAYELNILKC